MEFLRHPVAEWSQNFCDIQCLSGRGVVGDLVVADYLCIFSWFTLNTLFFTNMLNYAEENKIFNIF